MRGAALGAEMSGQAVFFIFFHYLFPSVNEITLRLIRPFY
jgi:hypothetical protein